MVSTLLSIFRVPLKTKKFEADETGKAQFTIVNEHFPVEVQRRNSKFLEVPFMLLFLCAYQLSAQENLQLGDGKTCPLQGKVNSKSKTGTEIENLNILKNRFAFPATEDIDYSLSFRSFLKEGDDRSRFSHEKAVQVNAFVYQVVDGGIESCNCNTRDKSFHDTQLILIINPENKEKEKRVIAEVTPRIRNIMMEKGVDWSTETLKKIVTGKSVTIQGWLLFDSEEMRYSYNSDPDDGDGLPNNRATAWEIHPVTEIKIH